VDADQETLHRARVGVIRFTEDRLKSITKAAQVWGRDTSATEKALRKCVLGTALGMIENGEYSAASDWMDIGKTPTPRSLDTCSGANRWARRRRDRPTRNLRPRKCSPDPRPIAGRAIGTLIQAFNTSKSLMRVIHSLANSLVSETSSERDEPKPYCSVMSSRVWPSPWRRTISSVHSQRTLRDRCSYVGIVWSQLRRFCVGADQREASEPSRNLSQRSLSSGSAHVSLRTCPEAVCGRCDTGYSPTSDEHGRPHSRRGELWCPSGDQTFRPANANSWTVGDALSGGDRSGSNTPGTRRSGPII
jgi:hypothetical protein